MNREDFVFDEATRGVGPYSILNPTLYKVVVFYNSKRHGLSLRGRSNEDITDFAEDIKLEEIDVHIMPYDPDKTWTEALINDVKIIPIGQEDEIRISFPDRTFSVNYKDALKEDRPSTGLQRAVLGILEADKLVRKLYPGYCLTNLTEYTTPY